MEARQALALIWGLVAALPLQLPARAQDGPQYPRVVTVTGALRLDMGDGTTRICIAGLPSFVDGAPGTARFGGIDALAWGPDGMLYILDAKNRAIRKMNPQGVVTTLTGAKASQNVPLAVMGTALRVVNELTAYRAVRPGTPTSFQDDQGNWVIAAPTGYRDGPAGIASFHGEPSGMAFGDDGALYVADADVIRRVDPADGAMTTFAGWRVDDPNLLPADKKAPQRPADGIGWPTWFAIGGWQNGSPDLAAFSALSSIVRGPDGTLYLIDQLGGYLRAVHPDGGVRSIPWRPAHQGMAHGRGFPHWTPMAGSPGSLLCIDDEGTLYLFCSWTSASASVLAGNVVIHYSTSGETVSCIRQASPEGEVRPWIGERWDGESWEVIEGSRDGPPGVGAVKWVSGACLGPEGMLYITDPGTPAVRVARPDGTLRTLIGHSERGLVDGPAGVARFVHPGAIAAGPDGALYVADAGCIRKIVLQSPNQPSEDERPPGGPVMPDEQFDDPLPRAIREKLMYCTVGTLAGRRPWHPWGPSGPPRFGAERAGAGYADGPSPEARFRYPLDVAVGPDGVVYVLDAGNGVIRTVTPGGVVGTLTGRTSWVRERLSDAETALLIDGPVGQGLLGLADGLALGPDGALYVADRLGNAIRKVELNGTISTLTGQAGVVAAGVWAEQAGFRDGPPGTAAFNGPSALAFGPDATLYVADTHNRAVRAVSLDGHVRTVARAEQRPGDGGWPRVGQQQTYETDGICVGKDGTIYFGDSQDHVVRKIAPDGQTVAWIGAAWDGTAWMPIRTRGAGDGARGVGVVGGGPLELAVDDDGTLYVSASGSFGIRVAAPDGTVVWLAGGTYGGLGKFGYCSGGCDGYRGNAEFGSPEGIDVGPDGALYVADSGNHNIRRIAFQPGGAGG